MPLSQQAKKGLTVLGRETGLDNQGKLDYLFHKGGKKDYVWGIGDPLEHLLVLPCPVIKDSGNNNPIQDGLQRAQTLQE